MQGLWHLKGRSVLELVEGGLSHEEAAGTLGISVGTAKSRVAYARDVCRANSDVAVPVSSVAVCGKRFREPPTDEFIDLPLLASMALTPTEGLTPVLNDPFPDFCDDGQLPLWGEVGDCA